MWVVPGGINQIRCEGPWVIFSGGVWQRVFSDLKVQGGIVETEYGKMK
jgi:hypothetical protein